MKKNIIFIDIAAVLFPPRLCLLPDNKFNDLLEQKLLHYISNSNADNVTVHLLNELAKIHNYKLVLTDQWINLETHKKQYFEELLHHNKLTANLHDAWTLPKENTDKTTLWQIGEWLRTNKVNNYMALIDKNQKNYWDFPTEPNIDYTHTIFVDPSNGISFDNIREINKSFKLWQN